MFLQRKTKTYSVILSVLLTSLAVSSFGQTIAGKGGKATACRKKAKKLEYKISIMGCPIRPDIKWNKENLTKLKQLGFNTMQLNIAWGARPADEPLNLEDVIELPSDKKNLIPDVIPPRRADSSPQRCKQRRKDLHQRIRLCKESGMRTLFHFGAPNNGAYGLTEEVRNGQQLPRCICDGKTTKYYVALLEAFAAEYPGVDDILIYTYDQDAWLCSEFSNCRYCMGVPLHKRVVPFINTLAQTWHKLRANGKLWWEPWELSAGQVLKSVENLNPESVGLMLHLNIAEVIATHPVDRWLKNTCRLAKNRGIPVIVEGFLGAASEELEPYTYLAHPLVTLRQMQAIASVPGVVGIKEYYGHIPNKEDANLRMAGIFFNNQDIDECSALKILSEPYGDLAEEIIHFWRLCSTAMELFPWETSWFIRQIGRSDISHTMTGAFIRGQMCHTPSWDSTRSAIFMKTDSRQPAPWMLEDVQLRCSLAADAMAEALKLGRKIKGRIRKDWRGDFEAGLEELDGFKRRALSYAYHLRETNLATIMRMLRKKGQKIPSRITDEMLSILKADRENQAGNPEIDNAIKLLAEDVDKFLDSYFVIVLNEDKMPKGYFTLTSR